MTEVYRSIRGMGILIVDSDDAYRSEFVVHLDREGFQRVFEACTAADGLQTAQDLAETPDEIRIVVLDYLLPDNDSPELIRRFKAINEMVVMVVTSRPTELAQVHSISMGAIGFAQKPSNPLLAALKLEQHLTEYYLKRQLRMTTSHSERMFLEVLAVMARIQEAKDMIVHNHSENVARLALSIARQMDFSDRRFRQIGIAGLLHDLGKMALKDTILKKPGPLDAEEWRQMKKHPLIAAKVLEPIAELKEAIPYIRFHHERFDGSGYPDGLSGENIPLGARIIHLAEAFDMMTTNTPYSTAKAPMQAIEEIRSLSEKQFDPMTVEAFLLGLENAEIVDPIDIITLLAPSDENDAGGS